MKFKCKEKIAEFRGTVSCDGCIGVLGWMWEGGDAERDGGIGSGVPDVCVCVCVCVQKHWDSTQKHFRGQFGTQTNLISQLQL